MLIVLTSITLQLKVSRIEHVASIIDRVVRARHSTNDRTLLAALKIRSMVWIDDHDILSRVLTPEGAELLLRPSIAVGLIFFRFLGGRDAGLSGFGTLEKVREFKRERW